MRLTNELRRAMVNKAIEKAGFPAKQKELDAVRADWANACRIDAIGGKKATQTIEAMHKRYAVLAKKYPNDLVGQPVNSSHKIALNIAGQRVLAYYNGGRKPEGEAVYRCAPWTHTLNAGHPLADRFADIEKQQAELDNQVATLRGTLEGTLSSFATTKALLKAWPEAAELLPKELAPAPSLPSVPVADLNAAIGLPSEGAK